MGGARGEGEGGGEWGKETIKNISMTSNRSGGFKTGFDQDAVSWLAFSRSEFLIILAHSR